MRKFLKKNIFFFYVVVFQEIKGEKFLLNKILTGGINFFLV